MFDLAVRTNSIEMDTFDAESMWTVGGVIKSKHWSASDLTILRAYEWDRINFSDPKKLKKTAHRMGITIEELNKIRRRTMDNAKKTISSDNFSKGASVKNAADIMKVTTEKLSSGL